MTDKKLEMERETIEISNDRPLYNYTFKLDGEPLPPLHPEDLEPGPPPKEGA